VQARDPACRALAFLASGSSLQRGRHARRKHRSASTAAASSARPDGVIPNMVIEKRTLAWDEAH